MQSYWSLVEDARDYFYPTQVQKIEDDLHFVRKRHIS